MQSETYIYSVSWASRYDKYLLTKLVHTALSCDELVVFVFRMKIIFWKMVETFSLESGIDSLPCLAALLPHVYRHSVVEKRKKFQRHHYMTINTKIYFHYWILNKRVGTSAPDNACAPSTDEYVKKRDNHKNTTYQDKPLNSSPKIIILFSFKLCKTI